MPAFRLLFWLSMAFMTYSWLKNRSLSSHYNGVSIFRRYLNRILFEEQELKSDPLTSSFKATLSAEDYRSQHIRNILKLESNDHVKCGVINQGVNDKGQVHYLDTNDTLLVNVGKKDDLRPVSRQKVSLILAVPRPLRLERILPIVSCLGVKTLALVGARKVEKDYFGSHLFRRPEAMKALLVEGLSQAAVDCHLPTLIVRKNLKHFLDDDLDSLDSHNNDSIRLIAHPYSVESEKPMPAFELFTSPLFLGKKEVVLAIGPEGGWEEGEVKAFVERGFKVISLGERILRTDIAIPVLMGMANEFLAMQSSVNCVNCGKQ